MKLPQPIIILFLSIILSSCVTVQPSLQKTEYVSTIGGGFGIDQPKELIYYGMSFKLIKSFDKDIYAVAEFENPEGGNAFYTSIKIPANQKRIDIQSEKFKRIENNKNYNVNLRLYHDEAQTSLITIHSQEVRFSIDPAMAKALGIGLI